LLFNNGWNFSVLGHFPDFFQLLFGTCPPSAGRRGKVEKTDQPRKAFSESQEPPRQKNSDSIPILIDPAASLAAQASDSAFQADAGSS